MPPVVVAITGPVAVGKTTVAKAAQRLLFDPWLLYEVDKCQPHLPPKPDLVTVDTDRRLRKANFIAARSYVDAGFRVLVEMALSDEWDRRAFDEVFREVVVTCVVLTAQRGVVLERSAARGDDVRGLEAQFDRAIQRMHPDSVVLDTTQEDPAAVAARLVALIEKK